MARMQSATQVGVGSSRWVKVNPHVTPANYAVQVGLNGGTASLQVEVTLDETDSTVGSGFGPGNTAFVAAVPVGIAGPITADAIVAINHPVTAIRVTVNSGTATVLVRVLQAGIV